MSYMIDDEIVRMQFDNQRFEENVGQSINSIEKLKKSLKFNGIKNGIAELSNTNLSNLGSAITTVGRNFTAMEAIAIGALADIGRQALRTGQQIVSALTIDPIKTGLNEYETKMNAIQVIKSNTRGKNSMDEIKDALDELNKYADLTIYNFQQMTSNVGKFVAQGMDVYKATNAIKGLANLAGASGASAEDMSRATYQMSQALGGTIRKIDWNSLRNANMATTQLKDILTQVAKVEGGIDVDAIIAKEGNFEESLSKGWLTGDLFTEAMNMYSDAYTEAELKAKGYSDAQIAQFKAVAKEAKSATTEVKTLTQLWDVLKETAQSGWTQTWEYIMGDFEQVKATLTSFNNIFSDAINASADARNTIFKEWNDLGGRDLIIRTLLKTFSNFANVLSTVKEAFHDVFPPATGKTLYDITKKIYDFSNKMSLSTDNLRNLHDAFKGVFDIIGYVKDGFKSLFDLILPSTNDTKKNLDYLLVTLGNAGRYLSYFISNLRESDEGKKLFSDIAKIGSSVFSIIKNIAMISGTLFKELLNSGLMNVIIEKLSSGLQKINEIISKVAENSDEFSKKIINGLYIIADILKPGHIEYYFEKLQRQIVLYYMQVLEFINNIPFIAEVSMKLQEVFAKLKDHIEIMGIKLVNFVKTLNTTKVIFLSLVGTFSYLIASLGTVILSTAKTIFEVGSLIKSFRKGNDAIVKFFNNFGKGTSNVENAISYFKEIALSVSILILSLSLLASIPAEDVNSATESIAVLMIGMMALAKVFDMMNEQSKTMKQNIKTLIAYSLVIFVLAASLKKLEGVAADGIWIKATALVGLLISLSVMAGALSHAEVEFKKGYEALLFLAGSVYIISSALGKINVEDNNIQSKIEVILGIMGMMTVFAWVMGQQQKNFVKGSSIMLVYATSILIISGAIAMLPSNVDIWERVGAIAVLMYLLASFSKNLTGNISGIIKIPTILLSFATSILTIASAVRLLPDDPFNLLASVGSIILLMYMLQSLASSLVTLKTSFFDSVNGTLTMLIVLTSCITVLAIALRIMPDDCIVKAFTLIGVSGYLLIFTETIAKMKANLNLAAPITFILAESMYILATSIAGLPTDGLLIKAATLVGLTTYLSVFSIFLSQVAGQMIGGAVSAIALATSLYIISSAFKGLDTEYMLEKAFILLSTMTIMSLISLAFIAAFPALLIGALQMIPVAGALVLLSVAFKNLDTENMQEKAKVLLKTITLLGAIAGLLGLFGSVVIPGALAIMVLSVALLAASAAFGVFAGTATILSIALENIVKAFELLSKASIKEITLKMTDLAIALNMLAIVKTDKVKGVADAFLTLAVGLSNADKVDFDKITEGLWGVMFLGVEMLAAAPGYLATAIGIGTLIPMLIAYAGVLGVVAALLAVSNAIIGAETAMEFAKAGAECIKGWARGMTETLPLAVSGVFDIFGTIVKASNNALDCHSPSKIYEGIGKFCMLGLVQGLVNNAKLGIGAVIDICNSIIEAALSAFGIHSPSKEFNYMGRMNVEGLVNGTEENLTDAEAAGEALAAAELEGFEEKAKEFNDKANEIYAAVENHDDAMLKMNELVQEGTEESIRMAAALGTTWAQEGKITVAEMQEIQKQVSGIGDPKLAKAFNNQWSQSFAIYKAEAKQATAEYNKAAAKVWETPGDKLEKMINNTIDSTTSNLTDKLTDGIQAADGQTIGVNVKYNYETMMYGSDIKHYANEYEIKGIRDKTYKDMGGASDFEKDKEYRKRMEKAGYKYDSDSKSWYKTTHIKGEYEIDPENDYGFNPEDITKDLNGLGDAAGTADDKVKTLNETLRDSINVFDEFSGATDLSSAKLLSNMKSQLDGMNNWSKSLYALKGKISDDMYEELKSEGTGSYAKVNALTKMSSAQLDYANRLYAGQLKAANDAANLIKTKNDITVDEVSSKWDKTLSDTESADKITKVADKTSKEIVKPVKETTKEVKKLGNEAEKTSEKFDILRDATSSIIQADGTILETVNGVSKVTSKTNKDMTKSFSKLALQIYKVGKESDITGDTVNDLAKQFMKANPEIAKFGLTADDVSDALLDVSMEMQTMHDSIAQSVYDSIDIFKEWDDNYEMTSDKMLKNMHSQLRGITRWSEQLAALSRRGISTSLLSYLQQLGPQGAEYVNAMFNMTDEQLKDANSVFEHSMTIGDEVADKLVDSYAETGRFFTEGFADGMAGAIGKSNDSAMEVGKSGLDKLREILQVNSPSKVTYEIGGWFTEGFANGIKDNINLINTATTLIGTKTVDAMNKSLNSNKTKNIGINLARGLQEGIKQGAPNVIWEAQRMCSNVANKIRSVWGINSPSKLFEEFGMYGDLGLAKGLLGYSRIAEEAGATVADDTMQGFKDTMGLSSIIDWDDLNPVITPQIDLTEVNDGFRLINELFNTNGNIGINGSATNDQNGTSNRGVVFNQYNNSPKALDRIEIYRQTKNQLSSLRGV